MCFNGVNISICNCQEPSMVFEIRKEVFVAEQGVPVQDEIDEYDEKAIHFVAEQDNAIIACGRVVFIDGKAYMGRIAIKRDFRRNGIGTQICEYIIGYCKRHNYFEFF